MEVVKRGDPPGLRWDIECPSCGSVIRIKRSEFSYGRGGSGPFIWCPVCQEDGSTSLIKFKPEECEADISPPLDEQIRAHRKCGHSNKHEHACTEWDFMVICEDCPEFEVCRCFKEE